MRERADRSLAPTGSSSDLTRARGGRWPWAIVFVAVAGLKAEAYASLVNDRPGMIAVLAVGLGVSLLRFKPVAIAVFSAPLLAFAVAPHPALLGVAFGVGVFAFLIALFFAISTVLRARQR